MPTPYFSTIYPTYVFLILMIGLLVSTALYSLLGNRVDEFSVSLGSNILTKSVFYIVQAHLHKNMNLSK